LKETIESEHHEVAAMLALTYFTGCPHNELRDVHWDDDRGDEIVFKDKEPLFLSSAARDVLDNIESPRSGYIFPELQKADTDTRIKKFLSKHREDIGFGSEVQMAHFRKNYYRVAIQQGVLMAVFKALTRLKHGDTIRDYYKRFGDDDLREAVTTVFTRSDYADLV
jgi:integrase